MTEDEFREMALNLPGAVESAHMGHPDFRVGGKIFATLQYPDSGWAMVKLPPDAQQAFLQAAPQVFSPVKGNWGRQGATSVRLSTAPKAITRDALVVAWRARAPKRLRETPLKSLLSQKPETRSQKPEKKTRRFSFSGFWLLASGFRFLASGLLETSWERPTGSPGRSRHRDREGLPSPRVSRCPRRSAPLRAGRRSGGSG